MTAEGEPEGVTRLLLAWNDGDESALEKLVPLVYNELRRLAQASHAAGTSRSHPANHRTNQRSLPAAG